MDSTPKLKDIDQLNELKNKIHLSAVYKKLMWP